MLGRLSILLLVLSLATAGCLGTGPSVEPAGADVNTSTSQTSPAAGNVTTWTLTDSNPMGWTAGVGAPGQTVGVVRGDECPEAAFRVPPNATQVTVTVAGDAVNSSRPGAGEYQLRVTPPEGEPEYYDRQDGATQSFQRGLAGQWTLYLEPVGANVNQAHDVTVDVTGVSPATPEWSGLNGRC